MNFERKPAHAIGLMLAFAVLLAGCGPIEGPQDLIDLFLPDAPPEEDLGNQPEDGIGDQLEEDIGNQIMDEFEQLSLGDEPSIGFVTGSKSRANCEEGFGGTFCEITSTLELFYGGLESQALIYCTNVRDHEFGRETVGPGSGSVIFNEIGEYNLELFEDARYLFARCELTLLGSTQPVEVLVVGQEEVDWD